MRRILAVAGFALTLGIAGMAMAASDLGAQREADMKTIGRSMKAASAFVQGGTFDAAAAKAEMEKVAAAATNFATLFPEGSEKADGRASPAIWQNKADFEAHAAKLASDATAAATAAGAGADAFKAAFAVVGSNCKGCHQSYRLAD
ncbi:cytochrome c [Kaistia dalseonensis]|uniref:Cytochrome c556 n=1 Tax=Kaistia dalseonensis TaxID=410840 RepID=A0ABU0HD57_9HYPH|nr:cytochrome c [Kaistia dalseonensis]MCX5497595.1 cytochrome c [Kaistia dalseonensis]MDQ0440237.1 cytochrome c556 [Kaistia dalseonensis]